MSDFEATRSGARGGARRHCRFRWEKNVDLSLS